MKNILIITFLLISASGMAQTKTLSLSKGKITAEATVYGSYTVDPTAKIVQTKWYKVSGFKSTIQTPDSTSTRITGLYRGIYEFGFIVKDVTHNLADTDYMKITVQ